MRRLLAVPLLLCVSASSAWASPALDALNAQRAASGLPAGIAENATWSAACAQHVAYMAATGTVTHGEDPAQPAYTQAGDWAGAHAVLSWSGRDDASGWSAVENPYEFAPLHLAQLLAPGLASVGVADAGGRTCMTTWPGTTRAAPAVTRIVTYPGHGAGIYAAESSAELPTTPAAALGLTDPTGPHLYVFAWGADQPRLARASLAGPAGPVAIRTVDTATPGVGDYLPGGAAIVIPVAPLVPGAAYAASVAFTDGSTHRWMFTALADARAATPTAGSTLTVRVRRGSVSVTGQAPTAGERVRVRVGSVSRVVRADADRWFADVIRIRPHAGSLRVAVRDARGIIASQRVAASPATARAG